MKQVAGRIKLELAQFRELAAFAQFGSDLDAQTAAKIERGRRIVEVFKQPQYNPVPVEMQACLLWGVQNGFFDDVPVDRTKEFQDKLADYLGTRKPGLLEQVAREKVMTDAIVADVKAAIVEFKQTFK
jgi:F-type H+-transporting ATPase subunit alpha